MNTRTEELQGLYNTLGTTRAVADHLGMSTGTICGYLRRQGVNVRKRGGDWTRFVKRNNYSLENRRENDQAFRAKLTKREFCSQLKKQCVIKDLGECHTCLLQHGISEINKP